MENEPIETTQETTSGPVESAALNLMLSDEAVTSEQDNFTDIINRAQGVQESGRAAATANLAAQNQSIDNSFGRAERELQRDAGNARAAFAQGSAMGTSTAQFKLLDDTINKNLNDIKSRKEEARLNADSAYLQQLNLLEVQYLEQKQQAGQVMFNNLMQIAGLGQSQSQFNKSFGLQARQVELQEQAQQFQQEQALNSVALEFGLELQPGETMESIINRATPIVQEMRGLEKQQAELSLEQMRSSIATQRAQRAQITQARGDRERLQGVIANLSEQEKKTLIQSGDLNSEVFREAGDAEGLKTLASYQKDLIIGGATADAVEMFNQDMDEQSIKDTLIATNPGLVEAEIDTLLLNLKEINAQEDSQKSNIPLNLRFGNFINNTFGASSQQNFGNSFTQTFN